MKGMFTILLASLFINNKPCIDCFDNQYYLYDSSNCVMPRRLSVSVCPDSKSIYFSLDIILATAKQRKSRKTEFILEPSPLISLLYKINGNSLVVRNYDYNANAYSENILFSLSDKVGTKHETSSRCFACPIETVLIQKKIVELDTLFVYSYHEQDSISDMGKIISVGLDKNFRIREVVCSTSSVIANQCESENVLFK